jgi:hypothetical protein
MALAVQAEAVPSPHYPGSAPRPGPSTGRPRRPARKRPPRQGVVYLLHFDRPYGPGGGANCRGTAMHYTGWTSNLDRRLREHANGQGARLLAVAKEAGISWELARTWPGGRDLERRLKNRGGASRRCPLCGIHPREELLPRNKDGSLSRSRTTDSQKAAAGAMTSAQLAEHTALRRGTVTGRIPGVERVAAIPADDPWYAPPRPRSPVPALRDRTEAARDASGGQGRRQATPEHAPAPRKPLRLHALPPVAAAATASRTAEPPLPDGATRTSGPARLTNHRERVFQ